MEDIKVLSGAPNPLHNDIHYMGPNRDRALGKADRTGRHYDEDTAGLEMKEPLLRKITKLTDWNGPVTRGERLRNLGDHL